MSDVQRQDNSWNFDQVYPEDDGQLAEFFKMRGQRLHCRLDIRLTSMDELKKAALLINELNKSLRFLAYTDERDEVLRVLLARTELDKTRIAMRYMKPRYVRQSREKDTTRSVLSSKGVGNLDKPWKQSHVTENKGETKDD